MTRTGAIASNLVSILLGESHNERKPSLRVGPQAGVRDVAKEPIRQISVGVTQRLALIAALLSASACVSIDRPGAQALGKAGVDGMSAIAAELDSRAAEINRAISLHNFDDAYVRFTACESGRQAVTVTGEPTLCDIVTTASNLRASHVPGNYLQIQSVIETRAQATRKLSAAYAALIAEAEYDARGEARGAIDDATAALGAFATALGAGPIAEFVTRGVAEVGGLIADGAQRRRLVDGSRRLQHLTRQFRLLLEKERELYNALRATVVLSEANARRRLIPLLPAGPMLNQLLAEANLPPVTDAQAQAIVTGSSPVRNALQAGALARRPGNSDRAFAAANTLLVALEEQHGKFQDGRPVSLSEMAAEIDRLTAIVDSIDSSDGEGEAE